MESSAAFSLRRKLSPYVLLPLQIFPQIRITFGIYTTSSLLKNILLYKLGYAVHIIAVKNSICYVKNGRNGIGYCYTQPTILYRLNIVVIITKIDSIARRNPKVGEHLLDAVPFRSFFAHNLDKIVISDGMVHIVGQCGFNALI